MEDEWKDWKCIKQKGGDKKKMNKILPVAILVGIVFLCSFSAVSAISVTITPDEQITCPQISEFWFGATPSGVCQADKTVTYTVCVLVDHPYPGTLPATVTVTSTAPPSWFDWLTKTVTWPDTAKCWPLNVKVPLTLGKDAGGTYDIIVTAVDSFGQIANANATLKVQDHDYVTETMLSGSGKAVINEDFKNMAIATNVKKVIDFRGEVDCLTKNEYLIVKAEGNNANFEQESVVSEYKATTSGDRLIGDAQFKSCAVMGGTGVSLRERYEIYDTMESRCENLNHHVAGDQRWKTELCTYNDFTLGHYQLDSRQSIPCSKSIRDYDEYIGNLTVARHLIYRRP